MPASWSSLWNGSITVTRNRDLAMTQRLSGSWQPPAEVGTSCKPAMGGAAGEDLGGGGSLEELIDGIDIGPSLEEDPIESD